MQTNKKMSRLTPSCCKLPGTPVSRCELKSVEKWFHKMTCMQFFFQHNCLMAFRLNNQQRSKHCAFRRPVWESASLMLRDNAKQASIVLQVNTNGGATRVAGEYNISRRHIFFILAKKKSTNIAADMLWRPLPIRQPNLCVYSTYGFN